MAEQSLYDRVGVVFAIAAVVNDLSDAVIRNEKGEVLAAFAAPTAK
jgi:hypothetical protein